MSISSGSVYLNLRFVLHGNLYHCKMLYIVIVSHITLKCCISSHNFTFYCKSVRSDCIMLHFIANCQISLQCHILRYNVTYYQKMSYHCIMLCIIIMSHISPFNATYHHTMPYIVTQRPHATARFHNRQSLTTKQAWVASYTCHGASGRWLIRSNMTIIGVIMLDEQ